MNVVIDTNVLYSWADVSSNPKLTANQIESLKTKHKLAIASVSIYEVIEKYRSNLPIIKKCFKPLVENGVNVVQIGFLPFDARTIQTIYYHEGERINSLISDAVKLKIEKEAEYCRFYLSLVYSGLVSMLIEENSGHNLSEERMSRIFSQCHAPLVANADFILDNFKATIECGHLLNDAEREVKKQFKNLLEMLFMFLVGNYESFKQVDQNSVQDIITDPKEFRKAIENSKLLKKVLSSVNLLDAIPRKKFSSVITTYIKFLESKLKLESNITDEVAKFFLLRIEKMLLEGSTFKKNDIIDMLILYSLYLKDYLVLTLDQAFLQYLKTVDDKSYKFCLSLISLPL